MKSQKEIKLLLCHKCNQMLPTDSFHKRKNRKRGYRGTCKICMKKHKPYVPEKRAWKSMISRCHNPSNKDYSRYGGRGITVCDRWRNSYEDFLADIGKRPSIDYSIERINVNGNYEPNNCKWILKALQAKNLTTSQPIQSKFIGISWDNSDKFWIAKTNGVHVGISKNMLSLVIPLVRIQIEQDQKANADYNLKLLQEILNKE